MLLILTVTALTLAVRSRRDSANPGQSLCTQISSFWKRSARCRRKAVLASVSLLVAGTAALVASAAIFAMGQNPGTQPVVRPLRTVTAGREMPPASNSDTATQLADTRKALAEQGRLLSSGRQRIANHAGYTATFTRQEFVLDEMLPEEEMQITLRHAPFAVRLDWTDSGQRVAYVEGEQENQLLVRLGGAKRLLGTLKIDPHGDLAMKGSRHPITEIGLLNLTNRVWNRLLIDRELAEGVVSRSLPDEIVGERNCAVFAVEYTAQSVNPEYRSTRLSIDREYGLPVKIQMTGWIAATAGNPDCIIEFYEYRDVKFVEEISPSRFDLAAPRG